MTLEPIPTPRPAFIHKAQNIIHTSAAFYCDWHHHIFGNHEGWKKKDMGGCGTTILGETIDQRINHEFNFSKALLFHYAHVY